MYFEDLNTKEYEILDYLGGNSLFRAYLARQVNLNRYVAIRHVGIDAAEGHPRFGNELAAYALLRHPNTARVLDAGAASIEGRYGPYLVREYIPGESLRSVLERVGRLGVLEVLRLGSQLLGALSEAHGYGLIHRQLCPDNLMLSNHDGRSDHLSLIDFASEQSIEPERWLREVAMCEPWRAFAAPELIREPPGPRSDIYSVGALLFSCLTGQSYHPALLHQAKEEAVVKDRGVGYRLLEHLELALFEQAQARYESALEFQQALAKLRVQAEARQPAQVQSQESCHCVRQGGVLTSHPSLWIMSMDPALDGMLIERVQMVAAHYEVEVLDKEQARARSDALVEGKIKQPWVVLFGDLHVILQHRLLPTLRRVDITQRVLISAKLNAQMLEAAVNFCGVDRHLILPVEIVELSELIEERVAICRERMMRQESQRASRTTGRFSITGAFRSEVSRHD